MLGIFIRLNEIFRKNDQKKEKKNENLPRFA